MNPTSPDPHSLPRTVGRGTSTNPPNRFESVHRENDFEQLNADDEMLAERRTVPTEFLPDNAKTVIRENDSPDVPFRFGINPYRGCEHGCVYCYARPYHETLGMNAGLDFETKILVKYDVAKLLRSELNHRSWKPEWIGVSGVTDCYQPAERNFRLTRSILEVMVEAHHPVGIITKNALILRDLDLLRTLAERNLVSVGMSITTLDSELARTMEPRTSAPVARLRAIRELSAAGVPVRVMISPIIPGLTDHELPKILSAAKDAGAVGASFIMLRLPLTVSPIFMEWLRNQRPLAADKVEQLIRSVRDGSLNDANFGSRMRGTGAYAEGVANTFKLFAQKLGLNQPWPALNTTQFRPPQLPGGQRTLF